MKIVHCPMCQKFVKCTDTWSKELKKPGAWWVCQRNGCRIMKEQVQEDEDESK